MKNTNVSPSFVNRFVDLLSRLKLLARRRFRERVLSQLLFCNFIGYTNLLLHTSGKKYTTRATQTDAEHTRTIYCIKSLKVNI